MDEIFSFVRHIFREEDLQRSPSQVVRPLRISDRSKAFLLTVGLPRWIPFGGGELEFTLMDRLPVLNDLLPKDDYVIKPGWEDYRFMSFQYDGGYALNEGDGGQVWGLSVDRGRNEFLNSSVELLGWFAAEWIRVGSAYPDGGDAFIKELRAMQKRMEEIDPPAINDELAVWPYVIEDAELFAR